MYSLGILIITLNSSCALAVGRARSSCEPQVIPIRPPKNLCISNGDGTCELYNSITHKNEHVSDLNFVCKNVSDYNREEEFLDTIIEMLKGQ